MKFISLARQISHSGRLMRFAFLVLGLFLIVSDSLAVSVRPIVKSGIILSIDQQRQTVSMSAADSATPFLVGWNKHTRFLQNGAEVASSALLGGTRVEARYFQPFFGKKMATQICWKSNLNAPAPTTASQSR
jgi:hypothetical protein